MSINRSRQHGYSFRILTAGAGRNNSGKGATIHYMGFYWTVQTVFDVFDLQPA